VYRVSGNAKPGLDVLSREISDPNRDTQDYAVQELSLFQADAAPLVSQLIGLLKEPDRQEDAVYLLKAIGPNARNAVPALRKLGEQGVESALDALKSIEKP